MKEEGMPIIKGMKEGPPLSINSVRLNLTAMKSL